MTDASGEVYQHNEYFPSGETFVQERHGAEHSSYLFSGKEQDEETGLYYFGARYLDPRIGIWYGVDPLAEKYPNASPYVYCLDNPVKYIDPDGKVIIPVHGTWSNTGTWENLKGIANASFNLFGDNKLGKAFSWTGGNYARMRTYAAKALINSVRDQLKEYGNSQPITLVGHSHGGNVSIEAINMMVEMDEFKEVKFNILTINTPVRSDYQLSEKALKRVTHVNVYDTKDPVQVNGGNSMTILPENQSNTKLTGEYGNAGRTFNNATNIEVDNPQGFINGWALDGGIQWGDYHNSHNRVNDWINKTEKK
jgi:RHS repeat-associated protein